MPANPYSENDSYSELWPFGEKTEGNNPLETSWHKNSPSWYQGRRRKAALVLVAVWSGTFALHWFSWGTLLVLGLTGVIAIHAVRVLGAKPRNTPEFLSEETRNEWPYVSLLVAAKNEEAVIERLVETLCNLDYPEDRCELWVIDDYSTDKTPEILDRLAEKYKQLRVFHRAPNAGGGKSGALNQVLPLTKGEFLAVFDADASVQPDVLRRVLPIFARLQVGAVQMRKAIANSSVNFWTKGQEAEMALDSYFQQQRIAIGGIGELRGNGQFIRRSALQGCGGFNEETITDDLDLTVRLHLEGWDIEFVMVPVQEEGVTNALALWHQRNRWAEGGYQRYLDYWSLIVSNRMGFRKTWDMFIFWIIQYFLPMATVPDSLIAIAFKRMPIYSPITALMLGISFFAMSSGLRRIRANENLPPSPPFFIFWQTLRGIFYMFHWIIVMASVTARMAVRPKRLKWVKTVHTG
ncbi:MAG: glycosyltransferase family 2 protein [Oscillatoriaceae bacterium SKW80]|nr:glycosyltransferase family 2 protein [Oscillatoriaceae bacterium SKYG93]MCX8122243.1 glycosyltransferase family 2 protein [Oscillatoriaceae bacterium SKW80]MDW8454529.1 glycosyltransferase family 2 protein [Oscillatoriaceae cyanobacterium SKYGB_i_bin93]HIK29391.1 glycosyltransferase family 2 protein [Oscillatoriaceae cyanobacterium M7585_C2015_266]